MDRLALRLSLAILAVLAVSQACAQRAAAAGPIEGLIPGDTCDDPDAPRVRRSSSRRSADRARARAVVAGLGAGRAELEYLDAVAVRESSGDAGVWHRLGRDSDGTPELGLGLHGLSLRWHRDKWPGNDETPAFCSPEVSALVAQEIVWRAVTRYHARHWVDVQAIYAGSWRCVEIDRAGWLRAIPLVGPLFNRLLGPPERVCRATPSRRQAEGICRRLADRGVDCWAPVGVLGRRVSGPERRRVALG